MTATMMKPSKSKGARVARPNKQPDTTTYSGRFAVRIRELRTAAGLSIDELAAKMVAAGYQISAPTLYHWENGNRDPHLDAVPALAKCLWVKIADIFPAK